MSRWTVCDAMKRGSLPALPGVYAIYFDGDLVYIGQSNNIANRFCTHKFRYSYGRTIITPWHEIPDDTRVTVKVSGSRRRGDWAMREIRLIHRLNPLFNRQYLKRVAA